MLEHKSKEEKVQRFIKEVRSTMSINFPVLAEGLDMDWWKDLRPTIIDNDILSQELSESLEYIKYELLQTVLQYGRFGKIGPAVPNYQAVKMIVELIDSGLLVPKAKEAKKEETDQGKFKELLEQLNAKA